MHKSRVSLIITLLLHFSCVLAVHYEEYHLLRDIGVSVHHFDISKSQSNDQLVTQLDDWRGWSRVLRQLSVLLTTSNLPELMRISRSRGKMQLPVPLTVPFPCQLNNTRSAQIPNSVHRLRPGDIDIIAAVGESTSAGTGSLLSAPINLIIEFRGISFTGGGLANWRTYLTLPNILKVYNPNLYGYANSMIALTIDKASVLNIAEPMIMSRDLPYQARVIIERMRNDPHVNMQQHWKMLSIQIGTNDFCTDSCHYHTAADFLQQHSINLQRTLSILRDNVPRLLVNIISPLNLIKVLSSLIDLPIECSIIHRVFCSCIIGKSHNLTYLRQMSQTIEQWQKLEQQIAAMPEYNTEEFAVVVQPFLANSRTPALSFGKMNYRFMAVDCVHLSQLGHAAYANALYNNLLQKVGHKAVEALPPFEQFECPSEQRPFIATNKNS